MKLIPLAAACVLALAGCATVPAERALAPVEVKIIAFNDFHGNLEPPGQGPAITLDDGGTARVPAGGAAYLASAIDRLRAANPNHVVVSAGDMIGASPLVSSLFLDEPTILAMNLIRVDFNAVGNHEFDKGRAELLRMQHGGCEQHTALEPCRLDPDFPGASFKFLAANTITEDGSTLLPPYGIRSFGAAGTEVKVGFIGMTLKETPQVVTPAGVAGLTFRDEAETANALIPALRAQGADAIVVLIHQGATIKGTFDNQSCNSLDGDLLPILDRLDPSVDLVVSGHTHNAYVCDYGSRDPARPFLLTSAGQYGTLVTDITLEIDPRTRRVISRRASNVLVRNSGETAPEAAAAAARHPVFPAEPRVVALVQRYAAAAAPLTARVIGQLSAPARRTATPAGEHALGRIIADAQLAATRAPETGGAHIAFMNPGGIRADLVPQADGSITYGDIFAVQPFGNGLVVKSFTGRQIRALLEQQFSFSEPRILQVSETFRYSYDLSRPAGQRIVEAFVEGQPLRDDAVYRVTMNGFLASGGDGFTIFAEGSDTLGGAQDVDALEAYIAARSPLAPPAAERIRNLTPS